VIKFLTSSKFVITTFFYLRFYLCRIKTSFGNMVLVGNFGPQQLRTYKVWRVHIVKLTQQQTKKQNTSFKYCKESNASVNEGNKSASAIRNLTDYPWLNSQVMIIVFATATNDCYLQWPAINILFYQKSIRALHWSRAYADWLPRGAPANRVNYMGFTFKDYNFEISASSAARHCIRVYRIEWKSICHWEKMCTSLA